MSKEIKELKQEGQESQLRFLTQVYQGPLPPPRILEEYEKIKPGAAQEIFDMAHKAQEHQISMEKARMNYANRNLAFNFILGLVGQIGTIAITLTSFIMAFVFMQFGAVKLGYLVASVSTIVTGYLIWWKVSEADKKNKRKKKK